MVFPFDLVLQASLVVAVQNSFEFPFLCLLESIVVSLEYSSAVLAGFGFIDPLLSRAGTAFWCGLQEGRMEDRKDFHCIRKIQIAGAFVDLGDDKGSNPLIV